MQATGRSYDVWEVVWWLVLLGKKVGRQNGIRGVARRKTETLHGCVLERSRLRWRPQLHYASVSHRLSLFSLSAHSLMNTNTSAGLGRARTSGNATSGQSAAALHKAALSSLLATDAHTSPPTHPPPCLTTPTRLVDVQVLEGALRAAPHGAVAVGGAGRGGVACGLMRATGGAAQLTGVRPAATCSGAGVLGGGGKEGQGRAA